MVPRFRTGFRRSNRETQLERSHTDSITSFGPNRNNRAQTGLGLLAAFSLVVSLLADLGTAVAGSATVDVELIIREAKPASNAAELLIERLGGVVGDHLDLIGGFTATVPTGATGLPEADASVTSAVPNASLRLTRSPLGVVRVRQPRTSRPLPGLHRCTWSRRHSGRPDASPREGHGRPFAHRTSRTDARLRWRRR